MLSLPDLSRLSIGGPDDLSEEEVIRLLCEATDDEDVAPAPKRHRVPLPLLNLQGVPVYLNNKTPLLISKDPTTWTALSMQELQLLFAASSLNKNQPKPLVSEVKQPRNIIFTTSFVHGSLQKFLLLGLHDLCRPTSDGGAEPSRSGGALVVLAPQNPAFENENETVKIKTIHEKTMKEKPATISTNPYRPTFVNERTFLRMNTTEIPGTRSVSSNGFEMFKCRPKNSPPMLKSLSVMQSRFCHGTAGGGVGGNFIETFQFVSAQLVDTHDQAFLQPKKDAEARFKQRMMMLKKREYRYAPHFRDASNPRL